MTHENTKQVKQFKASSSVAWTQSYKKVSVDLENANTEELQLKSTFETF